MSKTEGDLYCLQLTEEGRYQLDPDRSIDVGMGETLAGCAFGSWGTEPLLVVSNGLGLRMVRAIENYDSTPLVPEIRVLPDVVGPGFPEAVVASPGGVVVFSDNGSRPSRVRRYSCE